MYFLEANLRFASKIAANYICMFTTLSYLNKLSLYENVNSYLLVAHLELENACISQSFFYSFKNRFWKTNVANKLISSHRIARAI